MLGSRTPLPGFSSILLTALVVVLSVPGLASAGETIRARLRGFQEVPAVSTEAAGTFRGKIATGDDSIEYELSYEGLTGNVTQAHIHFAQKGVNGGISVWLCQTPGFVDPSGQAPTCPTPGGTVTGTISHTNVIGPGGQGIAAGEFEELLIAIRGGVAYANVHSTTFPGGEIRGQIKASHGHWDDD